MFSEIVLFAQKRGAMQLLRTGLDRWRMFIGKPCAVLVLRSKMMEVLEVQAYL